MWFWLARFSILQQQQQQVLAQKYGYELPKIEDDPDYEMLSETKDPRQIFYGLHPGWVVSVPDKAIISRD